MADAFSQDFAQFTRDKVRPAIDAIAKRKRSGLLVALGVGLTVFIVFACVVYFIMLPYQKMMGDHQISYWPLMILAPASLALIAFTLVYILSLRNTVKEFRESLIKGMTEFIDPGLVHEAGRGLEPRQLEESGFFAGPEKPVVGGDRFRGRSGEAAVEFCDVHVPLGGDGKPAASLTGIFLKAVYPKEFREPLFVFPEGVEASRSGIEEKLAANGVAVPGGLVRVDDKATSRQILKPAEAPGWGDGFLSRDIGGRLNELKASRGGELYLGCWGKNLYLAFLSRSERVELPGTFEGFDFGNCREFCREASTGMALVRELGNRSDVWKA